LTPEFRGFLVKTELKIYGVFANPSRREYFCREKLTYSDFQQVIFIAILDIGMSLFLENMYFSNFFRKLVTRFAARIENFQIK
jgi:hypothetical protein